MKQGKPWQPLVRAEPVLKPGQPDLPFPYDLWKNDQYVVISRTNEHGFMWLSIRREDRAAARDWRHFQRIKNEIAGPEREAVELYPAESRLADLANQYHLWVLPEGQQFPFGFKERSVSDAPDEWTRFGARQRQLDG